MTGFLSDLKPSVRRAYLELHRLIRAIPLIQYAEASGTTDGSGQLSVTFPTAFSSTPTVTATVRTASDRFVSLASVSSTGFVVNLWDASAGTVLTSTSVDVNWVAVGTP